MKPVVSIKNIGKRYKLGLVHEDLLINQWIHSAKNLIRKPVAPPLSSASNEIWALKNVSYDIMPGEVLGIIGRNGAGKSTLLKILSRITEPTEGEIVLRGRVASLLEVGTGFHPELTGRENVYLNGSILGMNHLEISQKLDSIVEFAEVEKFIDTPVKRYSSGMHVRLAFAVAAHLEPEILIIDEVLAVGDALFQKKCIGKMSNIAGEGRTVIFVSHQMGVLGSLCSTALQLEQGQVVNQGKSETVIAEYFKGMNTTESADQAFSIDPSRPVNITKIRVLNHEGVPAQTLDRTKAFRIECFYEVNTPIKNASFAAAFFTTDDAHRICASRHIDSSSESKSNVTPGKYVSTIDFPGGLLNIGNYYMTLGFYKYVITGVEKVVLEKSPSFELVDLGEGDYQTQLGAANRGLITLDLKWQRKSC